MRVFHYPRLETNLKMEILVGYREKSCEVCTNFFFFSTGCHALLRREGELIMAELIFMVNLYLAITVSW